MVPSNIGYSLREAGRHFRRNWSTVLGAIVTIFLSLFVIGLFVIGSVMVTNLVGSVEDRVTIQAFIADDANQEDVDALQAKVESWGSVDSVAYKSKEEALNEYKETMSNRNAADAVAALDGQNPVPASLVITLKDPKSVEDVASQLTSDSDFKKVADDHDNPTNSVQYGRETVERLFSVTYYLRIGAVVLVALLAFIAFVFINNTIRLAIAARRREIAIMRLVGASNGFIRGPFMTEGMLEALIGSILAVIVLHVGMGLVVPKLQNSLQFLSFELPVHVLVLTYISLVVIGMLLGLFGSMIAMRRYLKV
ncbi:MULTISPECIES: permease-like cell division protein FtsX [Atopobiaceae]|uniref:Cell division protein FtsX n=1 Tax=Parafannyhessea umbonata TaxID=604330 RepID=A0A1H9R164_9ACTN|nr:MULTISPECIES: permease-like cell division protein FtsX [Atopobiaceae]SEH62914.1 cell division transport system permease protein [Parafannyhessea umbonata]SER66460.1 cell division transport system permease protein [Parafannyhessea umbonata]SJZ84715.1 cell division transport system permease protein [Olsenella sp. KH1P3]